jgi:hypothetical protein
MECVRKTFLIYGLNQYINGNGENYVWKYYKGILLIRNAPREITSTAEYIYPRRS